MNPVSEFVVTEVSLVVRVESSVVLPNPLEVARAGDRDRKGSVAEAAFLSFCRPVQF